MTDFAGYPGRWAYIQTKGHKYPFTVSHPNWETPSVEAVKAALPDVAFCRVPFDARMTVWLFETGSARERFVDAFPVSTHHFMTSRGALS